MAGPGREWRVQARLIAPIREAITARSDHAWGLGGAVIVAAEAPQRFGVPGACPARPIPRMEPAEPMLRIDPVDPILRIDPELPMLRIEPAEPMLSTDAKLNRLPKLSALQMLSGLFQLQTLVAAGRGLT
ncbi:MAG TPA: hypothetical protein VGT61_14755 [Thermomicrobiales bacterium]|nr:hypothetical protein [Thermomicrobiales bacterium]